MPPKWVIPTEKVARNCCQNHNQDGPTADSKVDAETERAGMQVLLAGSRVSFPQSATTVQVGTTIDALTAYV